MRQQESEAVSYTLCRNDEIDFSHISCKLHDLSQLNPIQPGDLNILCEHTQKWAINTDFCSRDASAVVARFAETKKKPLRRLVSYSKFL